MFTVCHVSKHIATKLHSVHFRIILYILIRQAFGIEGRKQNDCAENEQTPHFLQTTLSNLRHSESGM